MASCHGKANSESPKMEQIITEFFAETLHIILESRCPYVSSRNYSDEQVLSSPSSTSSCPSSVRPRDKRFNLALRDCPAALENIDFWRRSNLDPMVVDVVLVQMPNNREPLNFSSKKGLLGNLSSKERYYGSTALDEYGNKMKNEKIIERWVLQYESRKNGNARGGGGSSKRLVCTSSDMLYKKSILVLRSLYLTVRLLPAYKLFRDLISSAQLRTYNLGHQVSSFVEPFTRREKAEMQQFVFAPVDTSCGRLCLSVLYRSLMSDLSSEPSTPISPQFIPDYVGSPMAYPFRRFPSGPLPQCSPSSHSLGRRHSWGYGSYVRSPPSGIPPASPTYSEPQASFAKPHNHHLPPTSLPRHLLNETPQLYMKNRSHDDYWPFPNFSPSPSLSPPTYAPSGRRSKALLRSEIDPVSIPASKRSGMPMLFNNQMLPPSPPLRPSKSNVAKTGARSGLFQAGLTVEKLFPFGKDEAGNLSRVKISSNSSPQKSFSRRSSWLSLQDDYDDSEFSGLFVVDGDDLTDRVSRPGSFDRPRHYCGPNELIEAFSAKKSLDAEVIALFCMLKKAPPLHQEFCNLKNLSHGSKHDTSMESNQSSGLQAVQQFASANFASSGHILPKTTADALEKLRRYIEMKNLLKQGEMPQRKP